MQTKEEQIRSVRKIRIILISFCMIFLGFVFSAIFGYSQYQFNKEIAVESSWIPTQAIIKNTDIYYQGSKTRSTCLRIFATYSFNGENHDIDVEAECRAYSLYNTDYQTKIEVQLRQDYPLGGNINIIFNPRKFDQGISALEHNNILNNDGKITVYIFIAIIVAGFFNLIRLL